MAGYKLPKVTQYVKNVGKSVAYASIDAIKANSHGVSDFIEVNNDVFREVYASAKNIRATIKNTEKQVKQSNLYKAIDIGMKNLIEDARTGNFYRDRTEDYAESIIGLDDEFDMEFQSGSSESASQKTLSDSISNAVGAAAISQNTAIAEGTGLIIKSNSANTKLMMASMEKISANFSAGMGAVYTGVNATNQFLNGPMMAHLENSRRYYEESTKQLRDQSMMLKEMLEMQRNLYKKQTINEKETRLAQSMTGTGGMNIKGYAKNVKSNIRDYMDSMGLSMFDMGGGGNPYLMLAASPFKLMLEPLAQRLMSPEFKKALRSFDKGIGTFFSQIIAKLNNQRDNSFGIGQIIGEIFGIKLDRKENINPGNYQRGAVPFDGVTRQAIIEVIPGYLSRIEAALTHSGERHYDHTSGTWKSARRIQKNFEEEENRYITQANSGWLDSLAPIIAGFEGIDKKKAKNLRNAASKMARKIYQDGGDFDPTRGGAYYDISDRMLEIIVQNMSKSDMRNIAQDTMRAIQNRSIAMRAHEANGGPYRHLFNGTYDMDGKGNGSKNLPGDFNKNNLLTLATDSAGKNVFYYLREILGNISRKHSKNRGSVKGAIKTSRRDSGSNTSSGSSTSSSNSSDDGDPDPDDDDAFWDSYAEEQRARAESDEAKKQEKKAKMQDWIKTKMGNSPIGKVLGNMLGGAVNVLAKPMEYTTKLLKKADEGMFQMMFGNKEYKLRNGEQATNVFQYIIDQVKGTFEELKDSIKKMFTNIYQKYLEPMLKPLWEKYGKPVVDELKNMGKRAGARVKTAFGNTFGRTYNSIANRVRNGDVVTADEIEGATGPEGVQESAFGRVVTKRGLTMISPGEIIIPASFDKREQNKMLALEKRDKRRILNAIQYNAKGTVDTDDMKRTLNQIYNDNLGKAPKNIAGGIAGAGVGLLTGINPLLGAAAGAGLSILSNSRTFQRAIFGEDITDENGNTVHKGGIIPKKVQDFFKKAMPDIGDFGITGGVLGLLTPFGPLGGAAIGAGIGMLKNSEGFKKFIFGDAETGKDGFISRETYNKVVDKIKGSVPNIAVGAVGGALLGPFGILGNAVMGAGLGLLTSTDAFHKFIFGHAKGEEHEKGKPRKGLMGALERGIIDPAKEKITEILDDFKKFAKKHVIEPLKRFWEPFQQMVKNLVSNVTNGIKDKLNDIFEKTIGIPIADFLQQKIFKPLTKTFFTILKAPYTLMKGAIAAPAHLLGFTGDNIRANQIRKGTAHDMTAEERLAWMQEHSVRNFGARVKNARATKKYGISFEERDRAIMGMSAEDQEKMMNMLRGNLNSMESLQRERGKARRMVGDEISTFFNTKDENGKLRYDKVGYGKVKRKLAQWAADGDFEKVEEWIKNANLSDQEKKDLMKSIKPYMQNAKQANDAMTSARKGGAELDEQLEKLFGRKMNRRGKRNVMEALKAEITARNQAGNDDVVSEEQENTDATNELNQTINDRAKEFNDRTKDILDALKDLNSNLAKVLERQKNSNARTKRRKNGRGITEVATEAAEGIAEFLPAPADTIDAEDVENATENAKGGFFKKKGLSMVSKGETILPSFMSKFFKKFDKDSKEAVEERQAEEKARKAEEEETIETKKTNSILMKLHDKFFGEKEESKKDGFGILSKLGSGFSKFSKFLGIGGKVALGLGGVSLFGHATEWFKTKIWPIMKTGLFGDDGSSGLLGGIVTKAKKWFETGGFHKLLSDKIIPSFITGLSYTMENVVGPGIALLIKHLPSILWGLAKGLFKGLKSLIFKDKMDGQEEKEMLAASGLANSSAFLSDFQKMNGQKSKALENNMSPEMKKKLSGITSGNTIAYGASSSLSSGLGSSEVRITADPTTNTSNTITNNYITQNADKFGDGELENPNETLTVKDKSPMGLLGRRKNTNIVRYDENGNVLTMYDTRNTHDSILSSAAKTAGLSFRKGLFSGKGTSKIVDAAANMKWSKPSMNIFKNIVGGTKNTVKTGAKGIGFFGNLGNKIHEKLYGSVIDDSRAASGLDDWFRSHGGEAAANFAEERNEAYTKQAAKEAAENAAEGAAKTGAKKGIFSSIKNAWNKSIGEKMANSNSKILKEAAEKVSEKGIIKGSLSTVASKAKDGVKAVSKMAGDAIGSSTVVKGLKEVFEKIAGSAVVEKICGFAKRILKKAVDPSIVQDAIRSVGTAIAEKCAKGTAKTAIKEATEQIANACTLGLGTIAFFVADFLYGYNNAYTMLGVAKGSEFEVNIGHKCACGLMHAVVNLIPFVGGFIPTNVLMQLTMEKILPIFGYDPSSLQAAQENSSKILDEWNKKHPEEQYDNLEDFNNKDKWTTKAKKWIKQKTKGGWGKVKDTASKGINWFKSLFNKEKAENSSNNNSSGYGKKRYGFSRYSQLDPSIAGIQYNGHTIGQAGCGPVAAANLINNIKGGNVSVQDTAKYATSLGYKPKNDGTNPKYMSSILTASGIPNENVNRSGIDRSLKQGNPVVIMGKGNNPSSPYGNQNPHYITAMGYDRYGNIVVDDPYENNYKTYKKSDVINGAMKSVSAKRNGFGRRFGFGLDNALKQKLVSKTFEITNNAEGTYDTVVANDNGSWSVGIAGFHGAAKIKPLFEAMAAKLSGSAREQALKYSTWGGKILSSSEAAEVKSFLQANHTVSKMVQDEYMASIVEGNLKVPIDMYNSGILKDYRSIILAGDIGNTGPAHLSSWKANYKPTSQDNELAHVRDSLKSSDSWWGRQSNTKNSRYYKGWMNRIDKTYKALANWSADGYVPSIGSSSGDVSNSSPSGAGLLNQFTNLGNSMVKAMFGEDAYNAFYGQNTSVDGTNSAGITAASGTVENFVQTALNEEGYVEKASNSNLDNKSANPGSSNYTKYGKHFGHTGPSWPWCAQFVSWSADQAGIPTDAMPRSASCAQIESYFKNQNRFHYKNGYTPKRGDVVLFTSGGSSHVGIVTGMKDGQVKTIEGNTSNKVAQRSYNPNDAKITGYGDLGLGAATGTTGLEGSTSTTNAYGKGGYGKGVLGTAKSALMANSTYHSGTTPVPARPSAPTSAGGGSVDYATFLQTIVTVLMNIADNTALLGKVLEILSNNFGIDIDKTDIDKAKSKTKAQTEKALTDLVNKTNGNTVGVSKLLNNKDTEYIVAAMRAIATE